jgi:hypothetical protein
LAAISRVVPIGDWSGALINDGGAPGAVTIGGADATAAETAPEETAESDEANREFDAPFPASPHPISAAVNDRAAMSDAAANRRRPAGRDGAESANM